MTAVFASILIASAGLVSDGAVLSTNATPAELVASCRAMIPSDVEL